uniref:Transmembrane protein 156 n=1 Tax=Parastrongyloides trichosuri TaxID=131310 RepID=A0A0N4ZBP5_PARTI
MNSHWVRVPAKCLSILLLILITIYKNNFLHGIREKRNPYYHSTSFFLNEGTPKESATISLSVPCQISFSNELLFSTLCQQHYHNLDYLCDPGGFLSRTEADLLHENLQKNYTSCGCKESYNQLCYNYHLDGRKKYRVYITIVPYTSYESLRKCVKEYSNEEEESLHRASFLYGNLLAEKWSDICKADIFIVYIDTWYPERIHKPFLITLFLNQLSYLYYRSKTDIVDMNTNVYTRIVEHMKKVDKIIHHDFQESTQQIIPSWAIITCVCLLAMVVLLNYLANKIIKEWACTKSNNKSTLLAVKNHSDRFRMGFAGHVKRHANRQNSVMKSSMMFRQFSRSREKQYGHSINNI